MREREKKVRIKTPLIFSYALFSASTLFTRNFARGLKPPLEGKNRRGKVHQCPTWFPNVPLPDMYTVLGVSTPLNGVSLYMLKRGVKDVSGEKVPCGNAKRPEIRYTEWWFGCCFFFRFQSKKNERAPSNNFSKRCLLLVSFHLLDVTDILNCIVYRPMYHKYLRSFSWWDGSVRESFC